MEDDEVVVSAHYTGASRLRELTQSDGTLWRSHDGAGTELRDRAGRRTGAQVVSPGTAEVWFEEKIIYDKNDWVTRVEWPHGRSGATQSEAQEYLMDELGNQLGLPYDKRTAVWSSPPAPILRVKEFGPGPLISNNPSLWRLHARYGMKRPIRYLRFFGVTVVFCLFTMITSEGAEASTASRHLEKRQEDLVSNGETTLTVTACERAVDGYYPQFPHGSRYDAASVSIEDGVTIGRRRCRLVEVYRPQVVSHCRGSCPLALPDVVSALDIWVCFRRSEPERIVRGIELRDSVLDVDPIVVSHVARKCKVKRGRDALMNLFMTIALADQQTFRSRNAAKPPYWRVVKTVDDLPAGARKNIPDELKETLKQVGVSRDFREGVVAESRCAVSSFVMDDVSWEVTCWDFFFASDGALVQADLIFNDILGYRINNPYRSPRTGTLYLP